MRSSIECEIQYKQTVQRITVNKSKWV